MALRTSFKITVTSSDECPIRKPREPYRWPDPTLTSNIKPAVFSLSPLTFTPNFCFLHTKKGMIARHGFRTPSQINRIIIQKSADTSHEVKSTAVLGALHQNRKYIDDFVMSLYAEHQKDISKQNMRNFGVRTRTYRIFTSILA